MQDKLKKNIFRATLIFFPVTVILLLEIILRITGYDNDLNYISTIERNGKNYYTMNQLVGKRYFGKNRLYYRKGSHDFFEVNKQPNTFRVFCFGASTMAGFPYEYNAIPSEFLRERLSAAFPQKNIEVINTAIAATNSFTVLQFEKQLVDYKPDLFIVYMGQNEFYGVYGVGSTISIGKSRWLIKTYLWLSQFKTFLLVKDGVNSIIGIFKKEKPEKDKILMEQMAENNSIGMNSSDYNTAVNTFRENYKEVIEIAKENNIPIMISTLVTNKGDLKPFVSMHSKNLTDSLKKEWNIYYNLGTENLKNVKYKDAAEDFNRAISIDSMPAKAHYELGKSFEGLGDYHKALKQLTTSADLDGLRFRAPSEFNNIIKKLSNEFNVPLADVQKDFQDDSEHGIIGNNLLVDHVHPNVKGYFLMAKSWFNTIKKDKLLRLDAALKVVDSLLWNEAPVTYLDSLIGKLKIRELKNRPPFQKVDKGLDFVPESYAENVAYQYTVAHRFSWGNAHLDMAKQNFKKHDYSNAIRELKAILLIDDSNPDILKLTGDMYFYKKQFFKAESYYQNAFTISNNSIVEYKLGITENQIGKFTSAINYLNDCLQRNNSNEQKFSSEEKKDIYYNLAIAYVNNRNFDKAKNNLDLVLKMDPENKDAKKMLGVIYKLKN